MDTEARSALWRRLKLRYQADVDADEARTGALIDSPMDWARGADVERIHRLLIWEPWTKVPL